jgi:hypothetical protein
MTRYARDQRPRLPRRPTSVDFAPTPEEVDQEWGPRAKEAMRAELHRRVERPVQPGGAEPEDESDAQVTEGEHQRVRRAVRTLRGD